MHFISPKIFRRTSPAVSRQLGFWVRCCTCWVPVVCRRFISVVLSYFSIAIVLSQIVRVFVEGRFASARMVLTRVVRSWPVMARPV